MTLTESASEGCTGAHSCLSSRSTASMWSRNARSVSSPSTGSNACTSSRNAARLRRAPAAAPPVGVGVQLVEDADAADHLAQELAAPAGAPRREAHAAPRGTPPAARGPPRTAPRPPRGARAPRRTGTGWLSPSSSSGSRYSRVLASWPIGGDEREVLEADAVPRAEQDARERDGGLRVLHGARVREHLDHLGQLQQPGQPDDLDGHAALAERPLQHAGTGGSCDTAPRCLDQAAPPSCSVDGTVRDPASPPSIRRGAARCAPRPRRWADDGTSRLSGSGRCAVGQRRRSSRRPRPGSARPSGSSCTAAACVAGVPSARRELLREPEQVVERGAAPRVDVLVGVADRGDRVAAPNSAGHQLRLRDVRVLVLVEQHGSEARRGTRRPPRGAASTTSSARSIWSPKSITPSSRFSSR